MEEWGLIDEHITTAFLKRFQSEDFQSLKYSTDGPGFLVPSWKSSSFIAHPVVIYLVV